jgi:hypothetical protein
MINILIASFKDVDLNNTIKSLINNSKNPNNLKIKILLIEDDNIDFELLNNPIINIIKVSKNNGVGINRKILTNNLPKNEYVLQLDSHHEFVENWDVMLIENYHKLKEKHNKIIISTSLPPLNNINTYTTCFTVPKIFFYTKNGIPTLSCVCGEPNTETGLISAHFLFGETSIFDELKYKDYWYFFGEEILLSMYAFNFGYKVFTPSEIIGWHKYNSSGIVNRDLKVESKTHKYIISEMNKIYNPNFSNLIGVDFMNYMCTNRNYNIHDSYGYDVIDILTPNNLKIRLYNQGEDIVQFSADGFFKGAVLYDTKNNKKKYFSLTN